MVELYSDSKYVIDALEKGWAKGLAGQRLGQGRQEACPEPRPVGQQLLDLCDRHQVKLHWVKGHASNEKNNRCDQLAVAEYKFQNTLKFLHTNL